MSTRRRRAAAAISAVLAWAGLLTGCTTEARLDPGTSATPTRAAHLDHCRHGCTGTIAGARYGIRTPATPWNGTLLLYSHGFIAGPSEQPAAPPLAQRDPGTGEVATTLLGQGYALAGSAYATTGWTVAESVLDAERLYRRFVTTVGTPRRVYVWGSSMGGLITELLAERNGWVTGAAPMCGVLGGPLPNIDNLAEAVTATQALLGVSFTGRRGPHVADEAVLDAVRRPGDGAARVLYLATLLGLPTASPAHRGSTVSSRVGAAAQNLVHYLHFALVALPDFASRFGGGSARAAGPAQRPDVPAAVRADIARLGGDVDTYDAALGAVRAAVTDATARRAVEASGDPTGRLRVPTITLHTVDDPVVLAGNEELFASRVATQGRSGRLVQVFVGPTSNTSQDGVGHCTFTSGQMVGLVQALDAWVRSGHRPSLAGLPAGLRAGLVTPFRPTWPTAAR